MKRIITSIFTFCSLAAVQAFAQTTQTFNYTGSVQQFTVPSCVTSVTVDLKGAGGGNGVDPSFNAMANGGKGGRVQATITVSPGDILYIYVGGAGGNGVNSGGLPGYNGGGQGGWRTDGYRGGGGGGASDIRLNGTALNNRIFIAAGGGGGGDNYGTFNYDKGGDGGGLTGQDGSSGGTAPGMGSGLGATQSAGGAGGNWSGYCTSQSGSLGQGGNACGGSAGGNDGNSGGGGGGGGFYGGGGGNWAGGGGGSSYASPSATGLTHTAGFQTGNGIVSITYTPAIPAAAGPITGPVNVCAGSTANYSISSVSGATSYAWSVPTGAVINSGQGTTSINVTFGSTSGTISVTPSNSCGSSVPANLTVTVNTAPVVNLGPNQTQCGGSVTLDAQNAGSTYLWSNNATTQTISVSSSGTYSVVVTNAGGCTGSGTVNVTINTPPTVNLGPNQTQCGGSVTLDAQNAGSTYLWSNNATTQTISVSSSGTYSVTVTAANGCTGTGTVNVTINTPPTVNLGADVTQCGGTVLLDAGTGSAYAWSNSATTQTTNVSASGTYSVVVTDANGCTGSDAINVTINTPPTVTLNMPGTFACINWPAYALSGGSPNGGTYSGPGVSGGNFDPSVAGQGTWTIQYDFTDVNGCQGSATQNITVDLCTGVNTSIENNEMEVFPNPASDKLNILFNSDAGTIGIQVLDMQGKVIYDVTEKNIHAGDNRQLDLSSYSNGIYFVKMVSEKGITMKKVELKK